MSKKILQVKDLEVSFTTYAGNVDAVRGISFHVNKGETLVIVGESGCGKSVSMQTIMKLLPSPPSMVKNGSILYNGEEILLKSDREMENYRGKEFAMIFQDAMTSLNPIMRIGKQMTESIIKHQKVSKSEAKEIAVGMLEKVGLPNPVQAFKRYPHTMSGGQRQRAMIAMALACKPAILFADEPTTALDITMQDQILEMMNQLKKEIGSSIVLVTHDLGVVAKMADRIAVMYAGQIVETATVRELFYNPVHPYTWGLLGSMPDVESGRSKKLYAVKGTPPDLFAPPKGCAFADRCSYCMKVCKEHMPPRFKYGEEHSARCWLLDKRAPKVESPKDVIPKPLEVKGGDINE